MKIESNNDRSYIERRMGQPVAGRKNRSSLSAGPQAAQQKSTDFAQMSAHIESGFGRASKGKDYLNSFINVNEYTSGIYTDAEFARCIQNSEGVEIKTDNPINWGATGDRQLTEIEAAQLKSKYNVADLSPQKYYDLMAELSQLNVISAQEVMLKYHFKSPDPDFTIGNGCGVVIMKLPNQGDPTFLDGFREQPVSNLLSSLKQAKSTYEEYVNIVSTDEFRNMNGILFNERPKLFSQFALGYQEEHDRISHLYSVINTLQ